MFISTKSRDLGRMKPSIQQRQHTTLTLTQPSAQVQCREQHAAAPHRKGCNAGLFKCLMLVKTVSASKSCPDFKIPAIYKYTHIACRTLRMILHFPSFSSLQEKQQSTAVISATITMRFSGNSSHTLLPY